MVVETGPFVLMSHRVDFVLLFQAQFFAQFFVRYIGAFTDGVST